MAAPGSDWATAAVLSQQWGSWAQAMGLPEWGALVKGEPHNAVSIQYELPPQWWTTGVAEPIVSALASPESGATMLPIPLPAVPYSWDPPTGMGPSGSPDDPIPLGETEVTLGWAGWALIAVGAVVAWEAVR